MSNQYQSRSSKELVVVCGGLLSWRGHDFVMGFPCTDGVYRTFYQIYKHRFCCQWNVVQSSTTNPAVVSIVITKDVPVVEQYFENPFNDLFGGNSPFFSFQSSIQTKWNRKRKLAVDQDLLFLMTVTLLQMHVVQMHNRVHGIYQLGSEI